MNIPSLVAHLSRNKRKVFLSFCQPDRDEVDGFIDRWATREEYSYLRSLRIRQ